MNRAGEVALAINHRVKVVGPLAENYKCRNGTVRDVYGIGGVKRYRVEMDNKQTDDFYASELRPIATGMAAR